jgi:CMP-N-acetylneuraminic acid synthetase
MNILVAIAARGGSKGVKDKNIRLLNGIPLIAYTIIQALKWNKTTKLVVSTDSTKIAKIAKKYGADVPFLRPKELAGDNIPKIRVLRHTFISSEEIYRMKFNILVDLDVTAPIRRIEDLDNCFEIFLKESPKTLFSVVRSRKNPYFNMIEKGKDGYAQLVKFMDHPIVRRQDAPMVYSMNASIYFYSREFMLDTSYESPITDRSSFYVMPEESRVDIDDEIDFKFVETLIKEGIVDLG